MTDANIVPSIVSLCDAMFADYATKANMAKVTWFKDDLYAWRTTNSWYALYVRVLCRLLFICAGSEDVQEVCV